MDARLLKMLQQSGNTSNSTEKSTDATLTRLPTTLLEAFIPGYSPISKIILDVFGFDVGIVVSFGLLIFAIVTVTSLLWRRGYSIFEDYFMSSVFVEDQDDLFENVLDWIGEQRMSKVARSVKAVTRYSWNRDELIEEAMKNHDLAMSENRVFNFGQW